MGGFVYCKRQQGETLCVMGIIHGEVILGEEEEDCDTRTSLAPAVLKRIDRCLEEQGGGDQAQGNEQEAGPKQRKLKLRGEKRRPSKRYSTPGQGQRRNKSVSWARRYC